MESLVAVDGELWGLQQYPASAVIRIDPSSEGVTAIVPIGGEPYRLAADGPMLWIADELAGLVELDTRSTAVVRRIPLSHNYLGQTSYSIFGVAVGHGAIWAVDGPELVKLSPSGRILATYPVDEDNGGDVATGPYGVYVTTINLDVAYHLDLAGRWTKVVLPCRVDAMAADGTTLWAGCQAGPVFAIDAVTFAVEGSTNARAPEFLIGLAVSAGSVYAVSMSGPILIRLTADPKAPTVVATAILDYAYADSPYRIDIAVIGGRVWVPFEGTAVYVYPA